MTLLGFYLQALDTFLIEFSCLRLCWQICSMDKIDSVNFRGLGYCYAFRIQDLRRNMSHYLDLVDFHL